MVIVICTIVDKFLFFQMIKLELLLVFYVSTSNDLDLTAGFVNPPSCINIVVSCRSQSVNYSYIGTTVFGAETLIEIKVELCHRFYTVMISPEKHTLANYSRRFTPQGMVYLRSYEEAGTPSIRHVKKDPGCKQEVFNKPVNNNLAKYNLAFHLYTLSQ